MTPIQRYWLVQSRQDWPFLHPIALLWDSVQGCALTKLHFAIIRRIGAISRLFLEMTPISFIATWSAVILSEPKPFRSILRSLRGAGF
jgi:hypothetical protein